MLGSIALICILGLFSGYLFSKMKLPSLIGMILVGILVESGITVFNKMKIREISKVVFLCVFLLLELENQI